MASVRSFAPATATVNIDVGAASAAVLVAKSNSPVPVRIMNDGTATVWIKAGGSGVAATTAAGLPIGAGAETIMTFSPDAAGELYLAAIAAAATGKIYFTTGRGV